MFNYIWSNITKLILGLLSCITYLFYKENKELKANNKMLIKSNDTNKKVIDAIKIYKPGSIRDNIERMRKNKL